MTVNNIQAESLHSRSGSYKGPSQVIMTKPLLIHSLIVVQTCVRDHVIIAVK